MSAGVSPPQKGAEIGLDDLLDRLAADCPRRRRPGERRAGKYEPKCYACYVDLMFGRPAADLMPEMRRCAFRVSTDD